VLSLRDKFEELRLRLGTGRRLESAGSDPIFYLVFPVSEILDVKRQTKAWRAKLEHDGWDVVTLSLGETVNEIFRNHRLRQVWLASEQQLLEQAERQHAPLDYRDINKTLAKALSDNSQLAPELRTAIDAKLQEVDSKPSGLSLITDLEALHPYLRINTIESYMQGRIHRPVIVLYPGKREGKTSLRFLEFYPADPNYRSDHIG
jgi:bacteriophage exclusion system BrxB-like protein